MMPEAAWISLFIFLISELSVAIWWAAKQTTLLIVVQQSLKSMGDEFRLFKGTYNTKEESAFTKMLIDKDLSAVWTRIDELKTHEQRCKNFQPNPHESPAA